MNSFSYADSLVGDYPTSVQCHKYYYFSLSQMTSQTGILYKLQYVVCSVHLCNITPNRVIYSQFGVNTHRFHHWMQRGF